MTKTWVEVNKAALEHNVGVVRGAIRPDVRLMAVVKANAYGHGLIECAKIFVEAGVDYLGVDSIEEGVLLREFRVSNPIVVLNPIDPARTQECVDHHLQVMAGSLVWITEASPNDAVGIHLKIDTGMGRQGVLMEQAIEAARVIEEHASFTLAEVATHFCCADDASSQETELQQKRFANVLSALRAKGMETGIVHAANSAATLGNPETHYDMVRVGLALYGMNPFAERRGVGLRPAMTWKTTIAAMKNVPAGSCIGYGCAERLESDARIALLPVGYADGYGRGLSSVGEVLVRGKRARVVGRVSMNLMTVDVTDVPSVALGDEVTLLGGEISAEELADKIDTINYEITTRIARHLPRRLV